MSIGEAMQLMYSCYPENKLQGYIIFNETIKQTEIEKFNVHLDELDSINAQMGTGINYRKIVERTRLELIELNLLNDDIPAAPEDDLPPPPEE